MTPEQEEFEERSAILEFDAGMDRIDAEEFARKIIEDRKKQRAKEKKR